MQSTENIVLAVNDLTGRGPYRRTSDPAESSQCCDSNKDRIEGALVEVMEEGDT